MIRLLCVTEGGGDAPIPGAGHALNVHMDVCTRVMDALLQQCWSTLHLLCDRSNLADAAVCADAMQALLRFEVAPECHALQHTSKQGST